MEGRYRAYPEYKDSGVEWLAMIPSHWDSVRLKFVATLVGGKVEAGSDQKYVGMENIESGNGKHIETTEIIPEGISNPFAEGDVLFGKLRPYLAKSWLAVFSGICSSEFLVLHSKKVAPKFLHYYTLTEDFIRQVDSSTYGSKMPRASWDFISMMGVPTPNYFESMNIANFLDHETAKIDTLIEKQQQLITLLQEKRQAVISHAVTKGLNPDAPMKDSGVEWLGEVPEHWNLPKLIHITKKIGDGLHSTPIYKESTGYYFVNGNNLVDGKIIIGETAKEVPKSEYDQHFIKLNEYSVLLSINGTIGNVAIYDGEPIILGKSAAYINCDKRLLPTFLYYYLKTSHLNHYYDIEKTGTTIFNLSLDSIRRMKICVPQISEQVKIVKYCTLQAKKFGKIISKAQSAIKLLQERRTALISAAVTGKIDIRSWKPTSTPSSTNEPLQ